MGIGAKQILIDAVYCVFFPLVFAFLFIVGFVKGILTCFCFHLITFRFAYGL